MYIAPALRKKQFLTIIIFLCHDFKTYLSQYFILGFLLLRSLKFQLLTVCEVWEIKFNFPFMTSGSIYQLKQFYA